nr:EOG090X091L [Eulimnadia texana]
MAHITNGVLKLRASFTWLSTSRSLSLTHGCSGLFYEKNPKSGYEKPVTVSKTQLIRSGLKQLKEEIKLWSDEWKEKLEFDPALVIQPGVTDVVFKFDTEEDMNKWVATSDQNHHEGFSSCTMSRSVNGKGLFTGDLSTRLPKDGIQKKAGYCNIRTIRPKKSFQREIYHNWYPYTHLVLRVRGDGRTYMVNLSTAGYFDMTWNDMYSFPLYTRGGPYWQITKIPFSKFFLTSKGRVQDKQARVPLNRISNFGITIGDKIDGPFRLELDYVGLEFDPSYTEEFAYEMYKVAPFTTGY